MVCWIFCLCLFYRKDTGFLHAEHKCTLVLLDRQKQISSPLPLVMKENALKKAKNIQDHFELQMDMPFISLNNSFVYKVSQDHLALQHFGSASSLIQVLHSIYLFCHIFFIL